MLKDSKTSAKKPKQYLDEVYRSFGDICFGRSLSKLPREPRDIYNARATSKKSTASSNVSQSSSTKLDEVWVLLEKAKVEEDESAELKFIRDFRVHPNFSTVLALERQLEEIVTFCTNPKEFSIFCIDPTFNLFTENISLSVTTYRNLKLEQKETGQPPVFRGRLLLHQKKDWKTYSRFANCLITEMPEIAALIACGTDGEKAIIDGFKEMRPMLYFLGALFVTKEILRNI